MFKVKKLTDLRSAFLAAFLAALLLGGVGCTPKLSPEELLARAEAAIDAGDLAAAEIDLKSALRDAPENAQGRALFGQINMRRLEAAAAVEQFERSLAAQENPDTRLLFAKALLLAGESAELVSEWHAGSFVTIEGDPQFQAALAQGFLAQAQPDSARAALERAQAASSGTDDDDVDFTRALLVLQLDRDQETSKALLEAIVERSPEHARAWSLLGLLAVQNKDFAAAEGFYEKAAAANPYRLSDRIQLVETQVRQGKTDVASSNLSGLESQLRNYPALTFLRAQLLFDDGNYEGAIDLFNQILSVTPDNPGALLLAANANARVNKLPIARRHFERFLELQPGNIQATLQLAQTNALMGEPRKTEELARALLEREQGNQTALTLLANALAAQGLHAESAQIFQQLTQLQPDSTANRVALGSQQIVAGDVAAGLTQLTGAVDKDPGSAMARERLIEARLVAQDLQGAADAAASYVELSPESARAAVYQGRVFLQQKDIDAAGQMFNRALELDPKSVPARGGLAAIAVLAKDLAGAKTQFEKALASNPGDLQSSLNLAVILEQQGDQQGMEEALNAAIKTNPAATAPRVALARKALKEGKPAVAIELLSPQEIAGQKDFRVQQTLTGAYILAEQKELALSASKALLELQPGDPSALALAARANVLSGDLPRAQVLMEQALAQVPDATPLRKQLIEVLVMQNELDKALIELDRLPVDEQNAAAVLRLRGRSALAQGDITAAVDWLAQAHASAPDAESLFLLSTARWMNGERDDVLKAMGDWVSAHPQDVRMRSVLAARLIEVGDESAAAGHYQVLIDGGLEDPVALNNMAWLLREEQTDLALEYIQRADKLAPDSASIKDTYAMVELERGSFDRALSLNQRAIDAAPDSEELTLNRARILARAGRSTEARQLLEKISGSSNAQLGKEASLLLQSMTR